MKMAFIVHNENETRRVMTLLHDAQIDYYTRWDQTTGKGHGTKAHLSRGSFASLNSVLMIAFEDESALDVLIESIKATNTKIARAPDHIRLFQLPLDCII